MTHDGNVTIGTELDKKGLTKGIREIKGEMGGLKLSLDSIAKSVTAAFGAKLLADFSRQAIELGSDLAEVQNVVDVTFTTMRDTVNEFAKNAAKTAGLSETMAKRYVGTFGAMAKAFGFTEETAANMSITLTQLAGDVASFYNLSQDEAYTKLKSVFTGETESLKDLGVVMTQAALDQFALSKGLGKSTQKMSEQEKVALRYQFVMEQLSTASGDFLRTSDGWANQTRILNLQFDQLKATLGAGFIQILTPAIQGLNVFISRLQYLADLFKSWTDRVFGRQSGGKKDNLGGVTAELEGASDGANDLAEGMEAVGGAVKEAKRQFAGFDQLEKLQDIATGGGATGGAGAAGSFLGDLGAPAKFDPNLNGFDTDAFRQKVDTITGILSTALLAVGAILVFSGASIPLGLGLMAAGALGLAAVVAPNWDSILEALRGEAGQFVTFISGITLILGIVLAFSGVALPLGIGLIAAGAAGLAAEAAINWDSISEALRGPMGTIVAVTSALLLVLGIVLLFTGAGVPLGLGLIVAGAAGLAAAIAPNWDFITGKVSEAWDSVVRFWNTYIAPVFTKQWWADLFASIGEGLIEALKWAANGGILILNNLIELVNRALSFTIPPVVIGGRTLFNGFSASVNIPYIPYLAKGAVIPPNGEFMAVLGDQKHGRNLEAPEDLIRQIVREESGNRSDEIVELLRGILAASGVYLDGKKISQTVTAYQRRAARAGGGL